MPKAVIGEIAFGERTTPLWWFGTMLVMIGLRFISIDANSTESSNQLLHADDNDRSSIGQTDKEK